MLADIRRTILLVHPPGNFRDALVKALRTFVSTRFTVQFVQPWPPAFEGLVQTIDGLRGQLQAVMLPVATNISAQPAARFDRGLDLFREVVARDWSGFQVILFTDEPISVVRRRETTYLLEQEFLQASGTQLWRAPYSLPELLTMLLADHSISEQQAP